MNGKSFSSFNLSKLIPSDLYKKETAADTAHNS